MRYWLYLLGLCPLSAFGQLSESFDDGDFTHSPAWEGDTACWQISGGRLQSRCRVADTAFLLSTPSAGVAGTQWTFRMQLHFNTSSKNYVRVYLAATAPPGDSSSTGYFVQIGGTGDNISLCRQDTAGRITALITGREGVTDHANNRLFLRVVCDRQYSWSLYRDTTGTGRYEVKEGNCTDSTYTRSRLFGIQVRQSTSGFFQKHFFDDIRAAPFVPDTAPPEIIRADPLSPRQLNLVFSEAVTAKSALSLLHYRIAGRAGPDSTFYDPAQPARVSLFFNTPLPEDRPLQLRIWDIADAAGNRLPDTAFTFAYHPPRQYDVLISEIFADPDPAEGLPAEKFVELRNNSAHPLNLQDWIFSNSTRSAVLPPFILDPDSMLILCSHLDEEQYRPFGNTAGLTGFPTPKIDGDLLSLRSRNGALIHAVAYRPSWYGDTARSAGGWSLEMKDTRHPCSDSSNWSASIHPSGGTPGSVNSVNLAGGGSVPDLVEVTVIDSLTLSAVFSQDMDSSLAAKADHYHIDKNILVDSVVARAPFFRTVALYLKRPLQRGVRYRLEVTGAAGCGGRPVGVKNTLAFGLLEQALPGDIILSEVLFHPQPGGEKFVELYNRSQKMIDLHNLYLARRENDGALTQAVRLSGEHAPFLPGTWLVVTPSPEDIRSRYYCKDPEAFLSPGRLPSYPQTEGDVVLLSGQDTVLDELAYREEDHFQLLQNTAGISLEKTDYNKPSGETANWQSAPADAGYATPTYRSAATAAGAADVAVDPPVISPGDQDGRDDEAFIRYRLGPAGGVANITVFDASGRAVGHPYRSFTLSAQGSLRWDGRGNGGRVLPTGLYILYIEIFNTEGAVKKWKLPVTVVRNVR
ncbi:lamin tail domain-containing protein [Compostibacter hankyongensis]|uniref:LTD domain-containing protein n=1 Tax=Compostibacter hankyongensis TaxID=1007089 RepID=A0ABP8FD81_9BACT